MPLTSGSRLGPYEIVSRLGAGGMGEVFKARDSRLGRNVAIKVLPPAFADDERFRARLEREAKAISQLSHPHICTLHDIGHENGTSYLVMELLEGETLAERIARGPLPLGDVLRYGAEVAAALDRAHRAGLIHRDLKPGNVMITRNGAKLLDFGLARAVRSPLQMSTTATTQQPLTAEGTIVGTVPYMSPEQLRGVELDSRSDIYALGVMLYEMAAGKRPFNATNSASLIAEILEQSPPPLPNGQPAATPAFEHVMLVCMQKDPELRFQCAADVAHELRWIAAGESSTAAVARHPRRSWPWYAAMGALLLAVITAALIAWKGGQHRSEPPALRFTQLTFDPGEESHPSISPDGKFIAFVKNVNGQKDVFLQRVDGRSAINLTAASAVDDDEPAFSPDGNQIAFRSERDGGGIFVMGATGESVRRVTSKGFDPAWSPDGKQIVFSEERTGDPRYVYGIRNLDVADVATGATRVLLNDVDVMQPSWSPHGDRIAFWTATRGERDIYTIDRSGRRESITRITSDAAMDWNPIWSPDGQWLMFLSDRDGTMNLWRIAIDEKSGRSSGAPEAMRTPASAAAFASIARDQPRVVFQSNVSYDELLRFSVDTSKGRLLSAASPVLSGSMMLRYPAISPDEKWIAVTSFESQEDVYVMKADGSDVRQLTNDAARDRGVGWWPDSSRIIFYSNRAGEYDAWSVRPDGSGLERLTAIPGGINFPRVAPDLHHMAYISDVGSGAAITDIGGALPVRTAVQLIGANAQRFIPACWSPNGKWIVGGVYGAPGLEVYSLDTKRFIALDPDARGVVGFLDEDEVLFANRDYHIIGISVRTREVRDFGPLPLDPGFRIVAIAGSAHDVLLIRRRAESDIWQMQFSTAAR